MSSVCECSQDIAGLDACLLTVNKKKKKKMREKKRMAISAPEMLFSII